MHTPRNNPPRRTATDGSGPLRWNGVEGGAIRCWKPLLLASFLAVVLAGAAVAIRVWVGRRRQQDRWRLFLERVASEAASRHGLAPALVKAVIYQESRFRVLSRGSKGEVGLMQITGGAVLDWERHTGLRCPSRGALFDPRLNVEIGTWYLARAVRGWEEYSDRDVLALAQYNAGRRNALKWAPEDPREKALDRVRFSSTREYIVSVLKYRASFERESP